MKQRRFLPRSKIDEMRFQVGQSIQIDAYDIKVTKIGNRYHARLFKGERIVAEMSCELRIDIGYICRQLMRTEDKMGGDRVTSASRNRLNTKSINFKGPVGKVWYR